MTHRDREWVPHLLQTWRRRLGLRTQLVVVTALIAGVVAVALVAVVKISISGAAASTNTAVMADRAKALVTGIGAASTGRDIRVPASLLDPGVVVYDDTGGRVAGTVPESMAEEFERLSHARRSQETELNDNYGVYALPFTTPAGRHGVAVLTEPLEPYENYEHLAVIVAVAAGGLLVLLTAGSAAWISKRALRPVDRMVRTADDWSEHNLEGRFGLGEPTDEIRALGATLDSLLDKVASAIRAEQRLTSELAHELRTPLTVICGTADLLAMRTDLDEEARTDVEAIRSAGRTMSTTITVLLDIARQGGHGLGEDRTILADLSPELLSLPVPDGALRVDLPAGIAVDVPGPLVIRALSPLITNATSMAEHTRVSARIAGPRVEILVADDGPGVPEEWADDLFTAGFSGGGGSGLGLPLARRVARGGGGDVVLAELHNPSGGATFAARFPGRRV